MRFPIGGRSTAYFLGALVIVVLLAAGCGGDGDGGGAGGDESYVKAFCEANSEAGVGMAAALTLDDEEQKTKAFADVLDGLQQALRRASPPSDVKANHDLYADALDSAVAAIRSGDADWESAFAAMGEAPMPSQEIRDRLAKVAEGVAECEGMELF